MIDTIGKTVSLDLPFEKVKKAFVIGPSHLDGLMSVKMLSGQNKGFTMNVDPQYIVYKE